MDVMQTEMDFYSFFLLMFHDGLKDSKTPFQEKQTGGGIEMLAS